MNTILGDLLEEYREVVLPSRGRIRATLWFGWQLASLVKPWMWGTGIGLALGLESLIGTVVSPLAEDTPLVMLSLLVLVVGSWTLVGFSATRRSLRLRDAILGGMIVAAISMALFGIASFVRVTVFLDTIKYRSDWVGLIARFNASGSQDLRAFVIAEYSRSIPLSIAVMAGVGAAAGGFGGLLEITRRRLRA